MLGTSSQHDGQQGLPPQTIKKRATAEEIQADLQERIARYFARNGKSSGCEAPRPRLARARAQLDRRRLSGIAGWLFRRPRPDRRSSATRV
jgi:hypothetical protein